MIGKRPETMWVSNAVSPVCVARRMGETTMSSGLRTSALDCSAAAWPNLKDCNALLGIIEMSKVIHSGAFGDVSEVEEEITRLTPFL